MIGATEYIAAGVVVALVGWGGWQTVQVSRVETQLAQAQVEAASMRGLLATCNARLANIAEAEERNNAIPDDLGNFVIPDAWRVQPDGNNSASD